MITLVILWPMLMLAVSMSSFRPTALVATLALVPVVVLVGSIWFLRDPLLWLVVWIKIPAARKPFLLLLGALGIEALAGIYFAIVPVSLDRGLVPLLLLVVVALCLFPKGLVRKSLIALAVGITLVFFLGGRTAAKEKWNSLGSSTPSSKQSMLTPYVNDVCDDAWDATPLTTTSNSLPVTMESDKCFGTEVHLPPGSVWSYVRSQPDPLNPPADEHWQISFQILDGAGRVIETLGPYGPMDHVTFQTYPNRFRLEGRGKVRFYPG